MEEVQYTEVQEEQPLQGEFWKNLWNGVVNTVTNAATNNANNKTNNQEKIVYVNTPPEPTMSTPAKIALIGGGALLLILLLKK